MTLFVRASRLLALRFGLWLCQHRKVGPDGRICQTLYSLPTREDSIVVSKLASHCFLTLARHGFSVGRGGGVVGGGVGRG